MTDTLDQRRSGTRPPPAAGADRRRDRRCWPAPSARSLNLDQFFRSWLIGFLFCLGLSLGSLALLMLQHLSGGQWGMVGRRIFEAGSRDAAARGAALHPAAVRHADSCSCGRGRKRSPADHILQLKAPYLNVPFFIVRAVVYFAVLDAAACVLLNRWSAAQDRGEGVDQGRLDPVPHGQRAGAAVPRASP